MKEGLLQFLIRWILSYQCERCQGGHLWLSVCMRASGSVWSQLFMCLLHSSHCLGCGCFCGALKVLSGQRERERRGGIERQRRKSLDL